MSRLFTGDEGFEYTYTTVRRDLPIEDLARVSRAGELRFVVDHYSAHYEDREDGENDLVFSAEKELGLPPDEDRGIYEAESHDVTPAKLFRTLIAHERKVIVPKWRKQQPKLSQLDVFANVQYRFYRDTDWDPMLAYLNARLPEGANLGRGEVKTFSSELLAEFDPEKHEPNREDGTGFLMYFLEQEEDECLPYLGLRILVHAIEHDLEMFDVDDEPNWRAQLWPALDKPADKAKKPRAKKAAGPVQAKTGAKKKR